MASLIVPAAISAAALYSVSGYLAWHQRKGLAWTVPAALLLHCLALAFQLFESGGLHIGVTEALSLFAWQSAALLWMFCWREPVSINGSAIYPIAAAFTVLAALLPSPENNFDVLQWRTSLHIIISLLSAGVLTLAAVQAVALAVQEHLLHSRAISSLSRLPPLQIMERLLFQMVAIGFGLLSLTLLSGFWFIDNWLAQHLAHKTILSIVAWIVFGVLLWGRWRYGWRGRIAIRWALSGYGILILAYFGTKVVLEQVLQKHWLMSGS